MAIALCVAYALVALLVFVLMLSEETPRATGDYGVTVVGGAVIGAVFWPVVVGVVLVSWVVASVQRKEKR